MLSIGGNHLIHALRRNVSLKIIMFNNQIYGLTKGQYSPTSEVGKITKSSPFGSLDTPFNPISVALAAEATFVARTHDMDRKHMLEMFKRVHEHEGGAFLEIYQNCNVFNDGAFEGITAKESRAEMLIELHHGEPIRFGDNGERGVVLERVRRVRDRERGRRRRGQAARARRVAPRSGARVRAVTARVRAHDAHADRRVPRRRRTRRTRTKCSVRSSARSSARAPATSRRCWRPAPRGTSTDALTRPRPIGRAGGQRSRLRNTIPVRGFGAKNVVFCGIRTPASAAARIWSTVTARSRIAGVDRALVDVRRGRRRVVAIGHLGVTQTRGARRRRSVRRRRRESTSGRSFRRSPSSGRGTRSARPSVSTRPERAGARHVVFERGAPLRARSYRRGGRRSMRPGRRAVFGASTPVIMRWIGCTQSSSGASSTTSAMIECAPGSSTSSASRSAA